jgi:hypothetical protein
MSKLLDMHYKKKVYVQQHVGPQGVVSLAETQVLFFSPW